MPHKGICSCNHWKVEVRLAGPLTNLNPRICDCDYCQANPSQIISDPDMSAVFTGNDVLIKKNGDQLANLYYCEHCNDLLAVGCLIDSQLRGAINSTLLQDKSQLGEPVKIQPRLLSAVEKLERWGRLWGNLSGLDF